MRSAARDGDGCPEISWRSAKLPRQSMVDTPHPPAYTHRHTCMQPPHAHQAGVCRQVLELRERRLALTPLGGAQTVPKLLRCDVDECVALVLHPDALH